MKILLFLVVFSSSVFAQNLEYPELNVTPRASDRIKMEAKTESDHSTQFWAIQAASLMTIVSSSMAGSEISDKAKDDGKEMVATVGMAAGAVLLGATYWMGSHYNPYAKAHAKLKAMPRKSKRDQLTLERMAEEEIKSLKSLGQKMRWISSIGNFALSAAAADIADDESDAKIVAALSGAVAIGSFFFQTHWERVEEEQDKYKKRIFGPVAFNPTVLFDSNSQKYITGMSLTTTF